MTFPLSSVRKSLHFIFFFIEILPSMLLRKSWWHVMFASGGVVYWKKEAINMLHAVILTRLMYLYFRQWSVLILDVWIS